MANYDARIILAGQPVNMLGALQAGNEAAAFQRDALHTRDYRNMLAQNGAGIMAGDQGALNALAGYDPQAALGVQSTRQDMGFAQQRMDMLTAQEKRAAEEYARGLSKEQAAAEAAQLEGAVKQALMLPDAATWDAFMTQNGMTDLVGQFGNRQALAGRFMSMAEVLKQVTPEIPKPQSSAGKLKADLDAGLITPEQFSAETEKGGMALTVGPDGSVIFSQGGARPTGKLTEAQSKDLVYWQRATDASSKLDAAESALSGLADTVKGSVPLVGNYMVSEEFQLGKQAAANWLAAILRKDTGAAITKQEFDIYGPMFLPMPGDTEATLTQKREARKVAEEAIRNGLGTAEEVAAYVEAQRKGGEVDLPQGNTTAPPADTGLQPGAVEDGFRFKGGDPADPNNWEQVQ
jgi:hypothetical protein